MSVQLFMARYESKDFEATILEITALGDIGSGKTTLLKRILQGDREPLSENNPFENRDKVCKSVPVTIEGKQVWMNVALHDSSGMESNGLLTSSFYRNKDGVILVWNCCDTKTLDHLTTWEEDLRHFYVDQDYPAIVVFANKYDLSQLNERFYIECVQRYNTRNICCFKTNPVTGEGVKEGFEHLLKLMGNKLSERFSRQQNRKKSLEDSVYVGPKFGNESKEFGCCS